MQIIKKIFFEIFKLMLVVCITVVKGILFGIAAVSELIKKVAKK